MIRSNPEQLIRKTIARFVDKEVIPRAQDIDEEGEFPTEWFQKIARMGILGIRYPKKDRGAGGSTTIFCVIIEELTRGHVGFGSAVAMQCLMGTNFLFRFGTDEIKEKYFYPAMRGEKIGCICMTEPEAGTDLGNVSTLATRTEEGYVINGLKTWVTNAPLADFYSVLCQTDPAKKFKGLNFFFVPRDTSGVSVSKPFKTLGTRTNKVAEVAFTDVLVPREHMLGREGLGMTNLMTILAEIRAMTAVIAIGLLRAALDDSIRYARERVAFGRTISNYQLIQAKIANMATDLEASKLMAYNATRMIDDDIPCLKEATMAKYFATEAACRAADQATRILAAYGYSMEYTAQRYFRDTRFLLSGGGTHEILQTNIAKWVGL